MPTKTAARPSQRKPKAAGKTGWPGPKSTALFEEEQQFIAPGIQSIALTSKLAIERGEGSRLWDLDGNSYLDFNVGVSVCSLGYSHPKYRAAMKAQLDKVTVGSFASKARYELVKLIASLTPGNKLRRT